MVLALLLLFSGVGAGLGASVAPAEHRASAAVAPAVTLPAALAAPWAARSGFNSSWSAIVEDPHPMTGRVMVSLTLWPRDLSLFAPGLSSHGPLTLSEFTARFAPSNATYAAVESYLVGEGLTITDTFADRLAISASGPVSAVERAFSTSLLEGNDSGALVHFPAEVPRLPASIAPYVAAVSGLSDGFSRFSVPFSPMPLPQNLGGGASPAQGRTTSLITPNVVHLLYGTDALYNYSGASHNATGVGIALVLWGDGYDPRDLSTFFAHDYASEFPAPTIDAVPVDGAPIPNAAAVNDPSQAPLELTLDLEWSGSEAPGATLYAVYAPDGPASDQYSPSDPTLEDALNTAVQEPGVQVVSMSFATADGADPSFQAAFETTFESAIALGITPVAASGDNGGTDNAKGACTVTAQPEFPAASPLVLAVGGTAPVLAQSITGAVTGIESQPAWKDSGGGYSVEYAAPDFQTATIGSMVDPSGHRGIPDVAGPTAYDYLYFAGQDAAGNGTSFAAPLWAGIVAQMDALRGVPFGEIDPHLYSVGVAEAGGTAAAGLIDVTTGRNCLGSAGPGWDTATGWGTPNAGQLYEALTASFVDVELSVSPSLVAPGGSLSVTVSVTNATSQGPIPGVPVNITLGSVGNSLGFSEPCVGTLSRVSATTNANGTADATVPVPACYIGSKAQLTATVLALGLYGSSSTTVQVNLLGLAGFLAFVQTFPYNLIAFAAIMVSATLVGWSLGNRRRRKRVERARALAAQSAAARAPTATSAAPAPAATGAPSAPAAALPPPTLAPIECPICGMRFAPTIDFCPRCGNYLPGREPSDRTTPGGSP
jgi:kumamolisin